MPPLLIVIAAILLVMFVLVLVIGAQLSSDYRGTLTHTSSRSAEDVWAVLVDPKALSYGGKQCRGVEVLSKEDQPLRWQENLGQSKFVNAVVEREEGSRFVTEGKDSVVPMTMRREITLEPAGEHTRVRVSQHIHIDRGTWHVPIFKIVMTLGAANAGMKDYLRRLAARLQEAPNVQ